MRGFRRHIRLSERTCPCKLKCPSVDFSRAVCNLHSQNFACTLFEAQFIDRLTDADGSPSTIQEVLNKVKRMIGWNTELGSIEREEEAGREGREGGKTAKVADEEGGCGGDRKSDKPETDRLDRR
jgi:hypothetical protein